ncbi:hypothetical protein HDU79_006900 [Rhizoclosmatium sp. JEL0117]|nr:hypothetical protein HDU79_006900 [Rhizoclosmatium sp. JEL0117]
MSKLIQTLTISGQQIQLAEDIVDKNVDLVGFIAGKAWPAANVLSEYLLWRFTHQPPPTPFRMLELGAGTGATSLFAGKAVPPLTEIFVSDLDVAVPLIAHNIQLNYPDSANILTPLALDWTQHAQTAAWLASLPPRHNNNNNKPPIDFVFASDVVYFPELFDPLIQTLVVIASAPPSPSLLLSTTSPFVAPTPATTPLQPTPETIHESYTQPEILLVCRIRQLEKELPFYTKLGKYFHLQPLADEEWDNGRFWSTYRGEYVMFRCVLRSQPLDSEGSDDFETMLLMNADSDLFD